MYNVIYKIKVENKIKLFIKSYKNIFLDTYTDTGLFYEEIIRQNYIDISERFYNEIIDFYFNKWYIYNILSDKI